MISAIVIATIITALIFDVINGFHDAANSISHALIGGISGAGVAFAGVEVLQWDNLRKTLEFIVFAPLIGLVLGSLLMFVVLWLFRGHRPQRVDPILRVRQLT